MNFPAELKYTKDHEWIKVEGEEATIGITEFAQGELGDIVFIEVGTLGESVEANEVFGTVEAVKTVSDLFMPTTATVLSFNEALESEPELVNNDPYGQGWIIKVKLDDTTAIDGLLSAAEYKDLVGA